MRTTLTLETDVAAMLAKVQKMRNARLKTVVNEALRLGLQEMCSPAPRRRHFKTKALRLGPCLIGSLDDVAEALARAEGEGFK
jgi:hypothetical protein